MTTLVQAFRSVMRAPMLGLAAIVCIGVGAAATIPASRVAALDPARILRSE